MPPAELTAPKATLGVPQPHRADARQRTRLARPRSAPGVRHLPGLMKVAIRLRATPTRIPLVGPVAAGEPRDVLPPPETELVEVPRSMMGRGETLAFRVQGDSMRDEGILPGDIVVCQKQTTARNGQTVIALVNGAVTIKQYVRTGGVVELRPANERLPPIVVPDPDAVRIVGLVVGVLRHVRQ